MSEFQSRQNRSNRRCRSKRLELINWVPLSEWRRWPQRRCNWAKGSNRDALLRNPRCPSARFWWPSARSNCHSLRNWCQRTRRDLTQTTGRVPYRRRGLLRRLIGGCPRAGIWRRCATVSAGNGSTRTPRVQQHPSRSSSAVRPL